jgi:toxin ParE1/3/4
MTARLTPAAEADLEGIWRYTTANWGEDQAEAYLRGLGRIIDHLAANPRLGRNIGHIREGTFTFLSGSHLIVYRQAETAIDVVRILHKRMDVEGSL